MGQVSFTDCWIISCCSAVLLGGADAVVVLRRRGTHVAIMIVRAVYVAFCAFVGMQSLCNEVHLNLESWKQRGDVEDLEILILRIATVRISVEVLWLVFWNHYREIQNPGALASHPDRSDALPIRVRSTLRFGDLCGMSIWRSLAHMTSVVILWFFMSVSSGGPLRSASTMLVFLSIDRWRVEWPYLTLLKGSIPVLQQRIQLWVFLVSIAFVSVCLMHLEWLWIGILGPLFFVSICGALFRQIELLRNTKKYLKEQSG